ncbi:Os07g0123533 [Oryza sativa Japonica Group]|uniref:Os07g0123533 protein n=1 Tax=Oryza sativa subsp. japonica TaxID=39947 RepID=A0A0P0X1T9_ORYSJ|nr:hypothetical protein EE612_036891 [Oryza sativa]BAS99877.1 Os07g0123533 [Oryza sativa Japonica Group]
MRCRCITGILQCSLASSPWLAQIDVSSSAAFLSAKISANQRRLSASRVICLKITSLLSEDCSENSGSEAWRNKFDSDSKQFRQEL